MALDVEAIWTALLDRLKSEAQGSFATFSRRRRENWSPEQQPVCMVLDDNGEETPIAEGPQGPAWHLTGEIVLMARIPDTEDAPTANLNGLIRAVRTALERQPTDPLGDGAFYARGHLQHYTNLGGKLAELAITKVDKGNGETTEQGIVRISLELTTK